VSSLKKTTIITSFRSASHFIGFYVFYGLTRPLLWLPLPLLYLFSDFLYLLACYFPGYRKEVVFTNLRNAFPEKTGKELKKIARGYYRHMCDSFVESFAAINMSEKEFRKRFVWKNTGLLDLYYDKGRSVVSVFGHYGNWEWLSTLPVYTKYKVLALYKPLSNLYFDRFMKNLRQKFGVEVVPIIRSYPVIFKHHEENIPTLTFFLGDQRPLRDNIRYWTRFLNQDTPVMLGSEQIARKLNQVVVFFAINRIKRGHYEVEIIPVTDDPGSTAKYEITELQTRLLEAQILRNPEYWLWSHRRWKYSKESMS
jgi:Kdo2-lipid IVA lauroyltransferase/acyltransferase